MIKLFVFLSLLLALTPLVAGEPMPLGPDGLIIAWTVAGPLPSEVTTPDGEARGGYFHDFLATAGGEKYAIPSEGDPLDFGAGESVVWKTTLANSVGALDFISILKTEPEKIGIAYAFCLLNSETNQDVLLKVGSNDGVRIWLNENLVHDHHVARGLTIGEDTVPVSLKKGSNRLLAKVENLGGSWALSVSVVGKDEKPAKGVATAFASESQSLKDIFSVQWIQSPLVRRTPKGEKQLLIVEIMSGGLKNVVCRVASSAWPEEKVFPIGEVLPGTHQVELQLPVAEENLKIRVSLQSATHQKDWTELVLERPPRQTIYLVQHTHTDIGYTRPPSEILAEHLRYIDYALDFCDETDNYPDDAKFRWTCEVSWTAYEFLKRRPPEQVARFKKRVQEGRIEIAGMFLNMAETATENSMAASLQPLRNLKNDFGIDVRTAMQNDVNGAAWCLVDYFNGIGLKYLTMGINKTRSLLPFDLPTVFWWESPSGKRIIANRAEHYHLGNFWKIQDGKIGALRDGLMGYLKQMAQEGYPFDHLYVQFSGYHTDNSPPSMKTSDLIRQWNEMYAWPKLRSATAREFFEWVEREKGNELPVFRVAWPDWWTDGFGSAARETAVARSTHVSLQASETAIALANLTGALLPPGTSNRIQTAQEQLLFYDEHTFGAAGSIGDPWDDNTMVQWGEKSSFAWDAAKQAGLLREEAVGIIQEKFPRAKVPTIVVWNTLSWARSGLVEIFIDHDLIPSKALVRFVDAETGHALPAQEQTTRTEGSFWEIWIENVPALGYKILRIERGNPLPAKSASAAQSATQLENQFYRVEVDPTNGQIVRLFDKELGKELVDPNSEWKIGALVHEKLSNPQRQFKTDAFTRTPAKNVTQLETIHRPIWQSIRFSGELEGCEAASWEYRLFETSKRLDLHFRLRKLPISDPEAIYVTFPFQFSNGKFLYEAQGGFVTPGENQLPRSASDWQTVQNFISLRNETGQVVFGSNEIPLVQFGDFNLGKWQETAQIAQPHVFSWILNNYWFTNFRATQEGELNWSYYLTSTRNTGNTAAVQFSWGARIPLLARALPAAKKETKPLSAAGSWLDWPAKNVILVAAHPAPNGAGVICHLREVTGTKAKIDLTELSRTVKIQQMDEVNVWGEVLRENLQSVSFAPFEAKFVRLAGK